MNDEQRESSDMSGLVVTDKTFPWLAVQRGGEAHLMANRQEWQHAYEKGLADALKSIRPYLPAKCTSIIDIGSGLGGVDMLIRAHYGNTPSVMLVDGDDKQAVVDKRPNATYSNRSAAYAFWRDNGRKAPAYFTPDEARKDAARFAADLIVSFGSWCFHYAPGEYLEFVKAVAQPGATIIVDIRDRQEGWLQTMQANFQQIERIDLQAEKYSRFVFHARA